VFFGGRRIRKAGWKGDITTDCRRKGQNRGGSAWKELTGVKFLAAMRESGNEKGTRARKRRLGRKEKEGLKWLLVKEEGQLGKGVGGP